MRSFGEIWFRLRQEIVNAATFVSPPNLPPGIGAPVRPDILPDPDSFASQLREPNSAGADYARHIELTAGMICEHRFPLFAEVLETGPEIRWRRDYTRGVESGTGYFRTIPYLDSVRAGDHKLIWELNRHQHLIVLAQAFRLTGHREFLDEIPRQLESWWKQNPWLRGINWASALEVAFRALSWIWVEHLVGAFLEEGVRRRLLNELYRHGVYLEYNLSIYFAPNTHLLGEAVALHALGAIYPEWPRSVRWKHLGGSLVREQMDRQVRDDGSHFEQSSYYHVYALDFFLLHELLADGVSQRYREKMRRMADYLAALSSDDGTIPLLGDDDGGNLFHPYGDRRRFGAATLASCCVFFGTDEWPFEAKDVPVQAAWWMGWRAFVLRQSDSGVASGPRIFPGAGVAVLSRTPVHIVADAHGFGHAGAGHSHAHALSVVCRKGDRDVLIDPGTFTYTGDPAWRSRFRGTAFHNTVRVDGFDQARDSGPFRWLEKPETTILSWAEDSGSSHLRASCTYRGIVHERQIYWTPGSCLLVIVDVVRGNAADSSPHFIEQFWHCGGDVATISPGVWRINDTATLTVPVPSSAREVSAGEYGWQSEAPGQKVPAPVIIVERTATLPVMMAAVFSFGTVSVPALDMEANDGDIHLLMGQGRSIRFSSDAPVMTWPKADAGVQTNR